MKWIAAVFILTGFNLGIWTIVGVARFFSDKKHQHALRSGETMHDTEDRNERSWRVSAFSRISILVSAIVFAMTGWLIIAGPVQDARVTQKNDGVVLPTSIPISTAATHNADACAEELRLPDGSCDFGVALLSLEQDYNEDRSDDNNRVYEVRIINIGSVIARDITLQVSLPPELSFVRVSSPSRIWHPEDLLPGESVMLDYILNVVSIAKSGNYTIESNVSTSHGEDVDKRWPIYVQISSAGGQIITDLPDTGGFDVRSSLKFSTFGFSMVAVIAFSALLGMRHVLKD